MNRTPRSLAAALVAAHAWRKTVTPQYADECDKRIAALESSLPSGSGINSGTTVEYAGPNKIVLSCGFHHIDEHGFYDGWTYHKIIVKPTFNGHLHVRVTGRDRNLIKEHLADIYREALESNEPAPANV